MSRFRHKNLALPLYHHANIFQAFSWKKSRLEGYPASSWLEKTRITPRIFSSSIMNIFRKKCLVYRIFREQNLDFHYKIMYAYYTHILQVPFLPEPILIQSYCPCWRMSCSSIPKSLSENGNPFSSPRPENPVSFAKDYWSRQKKALKKRTAFEPSASFSNGRFRRAR